jgi:TonB family protein
MLHRPPLHYPSKALAAGVEGTVVVQAHVAANGEVIDDSILSGPDELRKDVQQAVLSWHFDGSSNSATRIVNITFAKPAQPSTPSVAMLPMQAAVPVTPARSGRGPGGLYDSHFPVSSDPTLSEIVVDGLSDDAADRLRAQLPVHTGDAYTSDLRQKTLQAARQFDEHLLLSLNNTPGGATLRLSAPGTPVSSQPHEIPAGTMRVGANVQAGNLISAVKPIYPPLAKMARQQGTVRFQTLIAPDGTVEDLQVLPGAPPLLVQAAFTAVKQWVYKPTLLNGVPVEVATTVDVNFTLTDSFPAAQ